MPDARDRGRYKIFLGMAAGVGLSALREVALREVAEDVETKRRVSPFAPELELLGTREDRAQAPAPSSQAIQ